MPATLAHLRAQARQATLFALTTLADAMHRLGFVQADPIRAPARAQDLILRHRVAGYRAGDLDRGYRRLRLEENFVYAYGLMPPGTRDLLHPRYDPAGEAGRHVSAGLPAEVLAFVRARGPTHPADLEGRFGRERAINGWGGVSKATTQALEGLRHLGLLRVAHRRDGIRVYEAAPPSPPGADPAERARHLVLLVTRLLAPVSPTSLRGALALTARHNPGLGSLAPVAAALLRSGALEQGEAEGETYLWPVPEAGVQPCPAPGAVRLLAPFDPLVWDRRRFEHLWGWAYRFEAYTPPAQRRLGYYALPMLWGGLGDRLGQCPGRRRASAGGPGLCRSQPREPRPPPRPRRRAGPAEALPHATDPGAACNGDGKIINLNGAVSQAQQVAPLNIAKAMILAGIGVEVLMPLAILTGTADRAAGIVMAGYCMVTAVMWKQFWTPGDFWHRGDSKARDLFWDFLKNFSLAGGFLLLAVGAHGSLGAFLARPLASSHPYTQQAPLGATPARSRPSPTGTSGPTSRASATSTDASWPASS